MSESNQAAANAMPTSIELLVDGKIQLVPVAPDGRWQATVSGLSIESHTFLARSGEVESALFNLTVKEEEIKEDWSEVIGTHRLNLDQTYTTARTRLKVKHTNVRGAGYVIIDSRDTYQSDCICSYTFPTSTTSVSMKINTTSTTHVNFFSGTVHLDGQSLGTGTHEINFPSDSPITHFSLNSYNQTHIKYINWAPPAA